MIFNFLAIAIFSVPIERFPCGVNINGYLFDITNLANNRPNGFDVIREPNDDRYYFKMCGSLNHDDLPPLAPDSTDISVMRCNYSSHECASAIPYQSFDWQLINPYNPDEGVIYYASGEPFVDPEDRQYYTIDFEIKFKCDPNSKSTDISYDYLVVNKTNEVVVRITFNTIHGCPTKVLVPTPTPSFNPDCSFTYYFIPSLHYGVYSDFKLYNGGPYGIRTNLKLNESIDRTLFYQPCERMKCPVGYTCSDSGFSSAWLCNQEGRTCENYGLVNEDGIDAEIEGFKKNSSIIVTHHTETNDEKSISLRVGCNKRYNFDHFNFDSQAILSNNKLSINSYSHNACPSYNPKPIPSFNDDTCNVISKYHGSVNISDYNYENGYFTTVTERYTQKKYTLYFQPCGGLDCPSESQCDGDTNATVWLCEEINTNDVFNDCIAYGLIENNLTVNDRVNDLRVLYKGDRKRTALVDFRCDNEGKSKQNSIRISDSVQLENSQLYFSVYTKSLCTNDDSKSKKKISGGAIFLIILLVAIVLYISIGMIYNYIRYKKIEFPNLEFWKEFGACISTGFMYIIKCGHSPGADGKGKYDEI